MTRQIAFLTLLILSALYAVLRGGTPERIGAAALSAAAGLSVGLVDPFGDRFHHLEIAILLVDLALLSVFIWLSLKSTRFWPLWIGAMLCAEIAVHLMRILMPAIVPRAYVDALAVWSWVAQAMLIVATWRHRRRMTYRGVDRPWKS